MGSMGVFVYVWQVGDVYVSLWVSGYGFMGGVGVGAFGWCVCCGAYLVCIRGWCVCMVVGGLVGVYMMWVYEYMDGIGVWVVLFYGRCGSIDVWIYGWCGYVNGVCVCVCVCVCVLSYVRWCGYVVGGCIVCLDGVVL